MTESTVRAGVVGVGALGQHHARVWADLPGAELAGVYDVDGKRAEEVAQRHGCPVFRHLREMLPEAAAFSVAVPTIDHHRVCRVLIEAGKHVLVEKPMTTTVEDANDLIRAADERGVVLQVGHIERFNPAVQQLRAAVDGPRFIEVHRLAPFSPRSLDIDVVLDLMIHDLDIVASLDGSETVQVDAVGIPVLSAKFDIANARLRFASGLIANLTASRISTEKLRKFRVWAPRTYVSADLAARGTRVFRLIETEAGPPHISQESKSAPDQEPLKGQLASFLEAVKTGREPEVTGVDGRRALELAHTILERMAGQSG
jgi:predicted dehydrogenase